MLVMTTVGLLSNALAVVVMQRGATTCDDCTRSVQGREFDGPVYACRLAFSLGESSNDFVILALLLSSTSRGLSAMGVSTSNSPELSLSSSVNLLVDPAM